MVKKVWIGNHYIRRIGVDGVRLLRSSVVATVFRQCRFFYFQHEYTERYLQYAYLLECVSLVTVTLLIFWWYTTWHAVLCMSWLREDRNIGRAFEQKGPSRKIVKNKSQQRYRTDEKRMPYCPQAISLISTGECILNSLCYDPDLHVVPRNPEDEALLQTTPIFPFSPKSSIRFRHWLPIIQGIQTQTSTNVPTCIKQFQVSLPSCHKLINASLFTAIATIML